MNPFLIGQYDAHLARQAADLKIFSEDESLILDPNLEYNTIPGLSSEVVEKLFLIRPTTIVCFSFDLRCVMDVHFPLTGCREKNGRHDTNLPYIFT